MWPFRDNPLSLAEMLDRRRLAERMRRDWDDRARANAFQAVNDARDDWDQQAFLETGERNVREQIMERLDALCAGREPASCRVLEIGCGVGRMTRALAGVFGEVHGVDVSGEMLARARELLADRPNVRLHQNNGVDLQGLPDDFDLAFSFIVFQHIPSRRVIGGYVREVYRVLRPGGRFLFQVAGKPSISSRVMSLIINWSVPNTWVGVFLSEAEVRGMAQAAGFEIERLERSSVAELWVQLHKPL